LFEATITTTRKMSSRYSEALFLALGGIVYWIFSVVFSSSGRRLLNPRSSTQKSDASSSFFQFLSQFAQKGGIRHMFPGDDSKDSSIQFELISQVHCTTSVGKPISVTVRNTPTDRRRMRMFGGF